MCAKFSSCCVILLKVFQLSPTGNSQQRHIRYGNEGSRSRCPRMMMIVSLDVALNLLTTTID